MVLQVLAIAFVWIALFKLNAVLFPVLDLNDHVSWIFLPAALRLFAVLVFGLPGAAGLFLGSMLHADLTSPVSAFHGIMYAILSAGGPVMALAICMRGLRIEADLSGLRPAHLAVFSLVGAACNVIPNRLYMWATSMIVGPYVDFVPMFIGDTIGTVLMLYFAGACLRVLAAASARRER